MLTNYHTHTFRCLHAIGNDEDYVTSAITGGYKILGFSDHMMHPDIFERWKMRGKYPYDYNTYLKSLNYLKNKYKDEITIYKGMECEYFPELDKFLREQLQNGTLDYLILGNHYHSLINGEISGWYGDLHEDSDVVDYTNHSIIALKSGLFSCFAHPDIFMNSMEIWTPTIEACAYRICRAAKECQVPLEINLSRICSEGKRIYFDGIRYAYPHYRFFEIAKEVGNDVIIGQDAHNPDDFLHNNYEKGLDFAREIGIIPIEVLEFKKV